VSAPHGGYAKCPVHHHHELAVGNVAAGGSRSHTAKPMAISFCDVYRASGDIIEIAVCYKNVIAIVIQQLPDPEAARLTP
jgi:hypothetical protein